MASARFAWGIDVGNRALKAVKLVRDGDALKIDDFDLIEHENVLSNAGDNRDALIQTALANFVQRHPMKGGIAGIGVAGQSSFARFIKLPPVEPKKIPEIVKFEAIQQIPFPLDEVEWSYQLFQSPESPDVEVGIFAMRKDLLARQMQFFTDVDLNIQVVQMNPLAVYNAVYYDQKLKGTTMLVDLGAENTDLIICDNDSVWMRSIPIGGNNFTETLVKAFKLPFGKAEDLKRNAATSKYARQIFQAMRPVFADLVAEIQRSVGFYASVHRDSRIKKIIALGGTFRLPGLQKYLQQNMSLDVERLDNISAGVPSDPKMAAMFNENLLSAVSAYGLAVQAMGEGKITSSLLPAAIRRERLWKEKTPIFASSAAACVAGTLVALGGWWYQNQSFEGSKPRQAEIAKILSDAQNLDSSWTKIAGSGEAERTTINNVRGLTDYRDLWRNLLKDIEEAVPAPQDDIVAAMQADPVDVERLRKIPRNKREQLVIRSIFSRYASNLTQVIKDADSDDAANKMDVYKSDGTIAATVAAAAAPTGDEETLLEAPQASGPGNITAAPGGAAGTGGRGLVLTVRCTSPLEDATRFVSTKFFDALKKITPNEKRPKMEYEVVRVVLQRAPRVSSVADRMTELRTTYEAMRIKTQQAPGAAPPQRVANAPRTIGGRGPGPAPAAVPTTPTDEDAFKDRLIADEDVRNDFDLTLIIVVRLDPAPWKPPEGQPTAAAQ